MSELMRPQAELAARIGAALSASSAVVQLEPTLKNALTRLTTHKTSPADAIQVSTSRSSSTPTIDIAVDVTVTSAIPAVVTAADLANRIDTVLTANGRRPGRIEVNILSIMPDRTLA